MFTSRGYGVVRIWAKSKDVFLSERVGVGRGAGIMRSVLARGGEAEITYENGGKGGLYFNEFTFENTVDKKKKVDLNGKMKILKHNKTIKKRNVARNGLINSTYEGMNLVYEQLGNNNKNKNNNNNKNKKNFKNNKNNKKQVMASLFLLSYSGFLFFSDSIISLLQSISI